VKHESGLFGEGAAGLSDRRFDFDRFRSRVEQHWFRRKSLLDQGLNEQGAQELDQIRDLCHEAGVERLTPLAAALTHRGDGFLAAGDFARARTSYTSALVFSRDFPQANAGLASVAWKSGDGVLSFAELEFRAISSQVHEGWKGFRSPANSLVMLMFAGTL